MKRSAAALGGIAAIAVVARARAAATYDGQPGDSGPSLIDILAGWLPPLIAVAIAVGIVIALGRALGRLGDAMARPVLLIAVVVGGALGVLIGLQVTASPGTTGEGAAIGAANAVLEIAVVAIASGAMAWVAWLSNGHRMSRPIKMVSAAIPALIVGVLVARQLGG